MVVQDLLRLDRRIVARRHDTLGFAIADRLRALDHREQAAGRVVGDAAVRTLEAVADADVAKHVVRQRPQQPHRVHVARQVTPERVEVAVRLRHQREVLVVEVECAAAGAHVATGRFAERDVGVLVQRLAIAGEAGLRDRLRRSMQAEHVGAADQLEQLPIAGQLVRVVVFHLRRVVARPGGRVERLDRRDRRAALERAIDDVGGAAARGADRAGPGDDHAAHGWTPTLAARAAALPPEGE